MVAANESSYRSFASSETADTTLRPSVVMTYQSHLNLSKYTLVLAEGENATINAITNPTYYGVFWRLLSDNGVVSISFTYSSCTVTGVSAGETILEASMRDEDNELHKIECRIYVHIPSGVYRIRNVGNGKYLDVTPSGTIAGSEVKQGSSNITDTSRNVLFKITYLDNIFNNNLSYYSIRPMTNSGLGIVTDSYNPGEDVVLDSISLYESDSNFSFNEMWAITHSGSSCTIKNGSASTSSYLTTPNSSTSGAKVLISNTVTSNSKWVLEKYTGAKIEGISFTSSKTEVVVGDSFDYDACLYSSEIGVNGPVIFSVSDTDGTTTNMASINSSTGVMSILKEGTFKIGATYSGSQSVAWLTVIADGFISADLAAISFATEIYAASLYIRHEYSTTIYRVYENGRYVYYGTEIYVGGPHESPINFSGVPSNGERVALAHTHPNSNSFSSQDYSAAESHFVDIYVNGPNCLLQRYSYEENEEIEICTISPTPLTNSEKQSLYNQFYDSWYGHFNDDGFCPNGFDCHNITWPTS